MLRANPQQRIQIRKCFRRKGGNWTSNTVFDGGARGGARCRSPGGGTLGTAGGAGGGMPNPGGRPGTPIAEGGGSGGGGSETAGGTNGGGTGTGVGFMFG